MKLSIYIQDSDGHFLDTFDVTMREKNENVTTEEQFAEILVDHIVKRFNIEDDEDEAA